MARKTRPKKRRSRKKKRASGARKSISSASAKPAVAVVEERIEEEAEGIVEEVEVVHDDRLEGAVDVDAVIVSPDEGPLAHSVRSAEVVEIRRVTGPGADGDGAEVEDEVMENDLDLNCEGASAESTPSQSRATIPPPRVDKESEEEALAELETLQAEIDSLLSHETSKESADEIVEVEEAVANEAPDGVPRKNVPLRRVEPLPEDLDPERETTVPEAIRGSFAASGGMTINPPMAMPVNEGSSWGDSRLGGQGSSSVDSKPTALQSFGEVPLIGPLFVSNGRWRLSTVVIPILTGIWALVAFLIFIAMKESDDPLRAVMSSDTKSAESVLVDEVHAVVRNFASAPDWESKMKYVRAAGHIVLKVQNYYATNEIEPVDEIMLDQIHTVNQNGLELLKVEATMVPSKETFIAMLERNPHGILKVDWEVAVDYQEMDWNEFIQNQVTTPTSLRVVAAEGLYYNFQFDDDQKFRCYRLWYPHKDWPPIHGYTLRGSKLDDDLLNLITTGGESGFALILSLAFPEGVPADEPIVHIREIVSAGWVVDYEGQESP